MAPDKWAYQQVFLFLHENICCGDVRKLSILFEWKKCLILSNDKVKAQKNISAFGSGILLLASRLYNIIIEAPVRWIVAEQKELFFIHQKVWIFFLLLHQNIHCGFSFKAPRFCSLTDEYYNKCFHGEIRFFIWLRCILKIFLYFSIKT